ncbi:ATP-binding protein [Staphylococcus sp. EZ-P03]|uniref:ATP-binding protein n=1 Tax=Staphylococcus sp. EZ-P03 TaxID=2282739 RepID=UPI000DF83B88|nr:ATP-binding protein [Staphylococcus sp. EZ-P03]
MKKKSVLNLIKYHAEGNEVRFQNEAIEIARYFDSIGDYQLSEYIMGLLSTANVFEPQEEYNSKFLTRVKINTQPLPLPQSITEDVKGILNAVNHNLGVNKFLFEGAPGTGKTETVKQIARLLNRELYTINFSDLIDSKLGQTAKNIALVFKEINQRQYPTKFLILLDEIDIIAMDRINDNDVREMGRVTSTILKELDNLNDEIMLIATTNLYKNFDKALIRRFDSVIDFNRYTKQELIEVGESVLNVYLDKVNLGKDLRLFKKILNNMETIPYPGELKNLIKVSIAFSNPDDKFDYLRRLLKESGVNIEEMSLKALHNQGYTLRELEKLTNISKSQISRKLRGNHS